MINIKLRSRSIYIITVVMMVIVIAVIFLDFKSRTDILNDRLTKALAKCTESERQLCEITDKYNELKKQYATLEKTKAEERDAPIVYLTFDDGPSANTEQILDILERYGIKGTFFVIGDSSAKAAEIYRRLVAEGHSVGNHTYSHEYNEVYASTESFWEEYSKIDSLFYESTGKHLEIMRFPGGSNNTVSERYCKGIMPMLVRQAKDKGIVYFDWNVSSLDAEKAVQNKDVIINAVLDGCKGRKRSIVLMHDNKSKVTTVEALPVIIEALKKDGCIFKTLDVDSDAVQFLK